MAQPSLLVVEPVAARRPRGARVPLHPLLVTLAAAMLSGALQLGIEWNRRTSDHSPLGHHADAYWMVPLAALVVLLPLGLLLWVGRWWLWLEMPVLVALFTVAWMGGLLTLPGLKPVALVLLGLGLGLQTARLLQRWPATGAKVMRLVGMGGGALLLLYGFGLHGGRRLDEWRTLRALPAAPRGAPNILLIVLDTVRNPSLSLFGYHRATTPMLQRVARDATVFAEAYATAPWTLPSHAGMFMARYPHELNAGFLARLDDRWPTLAEVLERSGYATAGVIANRMYTSRTSGLARGFAYYSDVQPTAGEVVATSALLHRIASQRVVRRLAGDWNLYGRRGAAAITDDFLGWLPRAEGRPFFAFLNYFDAHNPYLAPAPWNTRFTSDTARYVPPVLTDKLTPRQLAREQDAYDGALAYLDSEVGRLMAELEHRGILDHTIVVIVSDHGEQFGEHGMVDHGNSLYRVLLQVPLVIRYPAQVPAGRVVTQPVSLRDLPRTLLDLAGFGDDTTFPGRSLARQWRSTPAPDTVLSELTWPDGQVAWSLVADGRHWIDWFGEAVHLYDLRTDSLELVNLADSPAASADTAAFGALRRARTGRVQRGPEHD